MCNCKNYLEVENLTYCLLIGGLGRFIDGIVHFRAIAFGHDSDQKKPTGEVGFFC